MYIQDLVHSQLTIDQLKLPPGQSCCFWGSNDGGIDSFVRLLTGQLSDYRAAVFEVDPAPGIFTFQALQELFEEELRNDDTDFLDRVDPGTTVAEYLGFEESMRPLLTAFALEECLDTGIRQLSSGQCRKLMILNEALYGGRSLILQNPYDGLDRQSCAELNRLLKQLAAGGVQVILLVNSRDDIPVWVPYLGGFAEGRLKYFGPRVEVLPLLEAEVADTKQRRKPIRLEADRRQTPPSPEKKELIHLRNGFAGYGGNILFRGLNLDIFVGDHTLIYGPNGCGKSTLLDIFTGDNSKCYVNDLRMFGKRRGEGESIWQIKEKIGLVSPALHRNYRVPGLALEVVLSGFFDSIGLYDRVSGPQIREGKELLDRLGLAALTGRSFRGLDFADQRLVLIARALIKRPLLLILDEPTHGLDDGNRLRILDLLGDIAEKRLSTILYVSHRPDEYRPFFKNRIRLDLLQPELDSLANQPLS